MTTGRSDNAQVGSGTVNGPIYRAGWEANDGGLRVAFGSAVGMGYLISEAHACTEPKTLSLFRTRLPSALTAVYCTTTATYQRVGLTPYRQDEPLSGSYWSAISISSLGRRSMSALSSTLIGTSFQELVGDKPPTSKV